MRICGIEISGTEVVYKKPRGRVYQHKKTSKGGRPSRVKVTNKYQSKTLTKLVELNSLLERNGLRARNFERSVLVRLTMKHLKISKRNANDYASALTAIKY